MQLDDVLDPVRALARWLGVRGDHDGPLFHNIRSDTEMGRGTRTDETRDGVA